MPRRLAALAAAVLAALPAHALYRSQTIPLGSGPITAIAVDPVGGRVFASTNAPGRSFAGSVNVLSPDGTMRVIEGLTVPTGLALSAVHRKLVVGQSSAYVQQAMIVDIDTLQTRMVATGATPAGAVVAEALGKAYMLGRDHSTLLPWQNPGGQSGTLTEIDLAAGTSRILPVAGMLPYHIAIDETAGRVYLAGFNWFRTAEAHPGFVQVLDVASGMLRPAPLQLGRQPVGLAVSPARGELYVLGHTELAVSGPLYTNIRPVIFVLDGRDLTLKRTLDLPQTHDAEGKPAGLAGELALDPVSGRLYVLDTNHRRLVIVDPAAGVQRIVDTEGAGVGIAVDPALRTVVVNLPRQGYAAVFSTDGERLDSVPLGRAAVPGETQTDAVATHPATREIFVANSHEGSLSRLTPAAAAAPTAPLNLTDLWWNPAESGWGIYLEQQGATLFAALFTRDAAGTPVWYVMSEGKRQGDGSFTGELLATRGPAAKALANIARVGSLTFSPRADGSADLAYEAAGVKRATTVTRQVFAAERACGWKVGTSTRTAAAANYTALWYDAAQPGWGLALSHRGDTAFGVHFGYDAAGAPTWSVMSNGERGGGATFGGEIYQPTGKSLASVGRMTLTFGEAERGTLEYRIGEASAAHAITRQVFAPLTSECGN